MWFDCLKTRGGIWLVRIDGWGPIGEDFRPLMLLSVRIDASDDDAPAADHSTAVVAANYQFEFLLSGLLVRLFLNYYDGSIDCCCCIRIIVVVNCQLSVSLLLFRYRCCRWLELLSSIADAPVVAADWSTVVVVVVAILLVLLVVLLMVLILNYDEIDWRVLCADRSIDAADQFFAVSPSKAKRIGVPPLLRTESTRWWLLVSDTCGIDQP